jgi:catechol 2,3-dioxygenase-like lactoylglutathione lyase family enzyme
VSDQPSVPDATPNAQIVKQLDHVYYWVTDMDRAVDFYRNALGLTLVRREGDSWAQFDAGGRQFALHGAVDGRPAPPPGGAAAVFSVDDLDRARSVLSERGVRFGHEGEVVGFARFAAFEDPDGNTVQLIEYARS